MKKSGILGAFVAMTLICTACGPDGVRIRDYAARAQLIGEDFFGESIAPVSLMMKSFGIEATAETEEAEETKAETEEPEIAAESEASPEGAKVGSEVTTAPKGAKIGSTAETGEIEATSESKKADTKAAARKEKATAETEAASETETETKEAETASEPETEAKETETASESETETEETETASEAEETEGSEGTEETEESETASQPGEEALIVLTGGLSDRDLAAMEGKAASLEGKLAGRDTLNAEERRALGAVWDRGGYGSRTECLVLSGAVPGAEVKTGCFLFLFDGPRLNAADVAKGDLWFVCGDRVQNVLQDIQADRLHLLEGGEGFAVLLKGKQDGKACVRVAVGTGTGAAVRFADALDIGETKDGLTVFYAPEHFRYDPLTEEWEQGDGAIPYYYERKENSFEPLPVLELSLEEYLAYLSEKADDPEAGAWTEAQRKLFSEAGDGTEYRFFGIGEDRIGYQAREIAEDAEGDPCAEYRYVIYELQKGTLTEACPAAEGEGYYHSDRQKIEEELAALNEVPERYTSNRVDQAHTALKAGERQVLDAVLEAQEYPADALCFVSLADCDGDRETEGFVAVGNYDGAFGAPVCDLWYWGQDGPRLLEERCPLKNAGICRVGRNALYLWKGWGSDILYSVEEKQPCRYLEGAQRIEVGADGDIDAWFADGAGSSPWPYHYENGKVEAYGMYETEPEALLDFENGAAVLKALRYRAPDGFSCLAGENGLWYVTVSDADGSRRYEIYHVRDGELVLTDCGDGGYDAADADGGKVGAVGGSGEGEKASAVGGSGEGERAGAAGGSGEGGKAAGESGAAGKADAGEGSGAAGSQRGE